MSVAEQRSFLTNRVGTKLFGDNITIHDDVRHPLQTGAPFDGEGLPRQSLPLVEKGIVRNLVYAQKTAAEAGVKGYEVTSWNGMFAPRDVKLADGREHDSGAVRIV